MTYAHDNRGAQCSQEHGDVGNNRIISRFLIGIRSRPRDICLYIEPSEKTKAEVRMQRRKTFSSESALRAVRLK